MPRLLQAALVSVALGASSLALAQTQTTPPTDKPPSTIAPSDKNPSGKTPPDKTAPPSVTPGGGSAAPQWYRPQAGELRASEVIGMAVKNAAGESVGDINEVVLGKDGKIAAVVIGVGGFLGIGQREVAVRFESLQLTRGADQQTTATLNVSKEALKSAPQWKWSSEKGR
jgi:hypothetical protein